MRLVVGVVGVVGLCVACGDNVHVDEEIGAVSGTRLKVQRYRYDDGTEQPGGPELYDTTLHTLCAPRPWSDDIVRCVPIADQAVYIDATCSMVVGVAQTIAAPTHFIVYEQIGLEVRPTRVFEAGDVTPSITSYFEKQDGACIGPFAPPDAVYFALADEIDGATLLPVRDAELGDGRLGLRLREADDGLRLPFGLHDRMLDLDCTPAPQSDGTFACAPTDALATSDFDDPSCEQPAIVIEPGAPVPSIVAVVEPSGCTGYRAVGGETIAPRYRRTGTDCLASSLAPGERLFAADAAVELPGLVRTLDAVPGRRLERILLRDGDLLFADDRLFDTATRADCARHDFDPVTRCIPAELAPETALFSAGCAVPIPVAELPMRTCTRLAFATATSDAGIEIRAIGDPVTDTLYQFDGGQCTPHAAAPDTVMHALGPPIDPTAFVGALYFGER